MVWSHPVRTREPLCREYRGNMPPECPGFKTDSANILTGRRIHRDADYLIQEFKQYMGRTVEQSADIVLDAAIVKGAEGHGQYMSEGKIKQ